MVGAAFVLEFAVAANEHWHESGEKEGRRIPVDHDVSALALEGICGMSDR